MGKSKQDYISRVETDPNIPVFYQPWWLDTMAGPAGWNAVVSYEKERITGIWPFTISRRWGQKISSPLPLTPYLGPQFYYPDNQHKITAKASFMENSLTQLIAGLKEEGFKFFSQYTPPNFANAPVLQWNDFSQGAVFRFVIHTLNDLELTHQNFKYNTRHTIKKFNESGTIREEYDPERLYELILASFNRRQQKPGFSKAVFLKLATELQAKVDVKIYFASDEESENLAGILVLISQGRAYLLSTGLKGKANGAVTALIWHGMQMAGNKVTTFDFCGSMIPGIYNFFKGFGGQLEPYYQLRYFSSKSMRLLYTLSGKV